MAILVTGGAGFIGSHTCVELLNAGYDVVVVDNLVNSSRESLNRVQEITGKTLRFYEVNLLDLITKTYLYNLDGIDFSEVVDFGESLKQKYPKEYRTWWIMGLFYSMSAINYIYPE